jgi:hypothetical protein
VQQRVANEVDRSICQARQALNIALKTLQMCGQQLETSISLPQPAGGSKFFGSFNVPQEPHALLRHLRTRECQTLYNMALADTMDYTRGRRQTLEEAKSRLYEVMGRSTSPGDELPWPLQRQVLKLQGQVLLELDHPQEAAEMFALHQYELQGFL